MSLDFCCDIQMVGSEFGVKNMKAWIHPALSQMVLFHCMVRHGKAQYGSLLFFYPLGTVPGTWYFFSTTPAEVPSDPYRYQNITCKLYWSLIGRKKIVFTASLNMRHETQHRPARFKSAQPAKDRTQLLFEQTHIFVSTKKCLFRCMLRNMYVEEYVFWFLFICLPLYMCFSSIKNNLIE